VQGTPLAGAVIGFCPLFLCFLPWVFFWWSVPKFLYSFFLFFARAREDRPQSLYSCGFAAFFEFREFRLFPSLFRLFPSVIHNPSSNLFDGIYVFRRKMFLILKAFSEAAALYPCGYSSLTMTFLR
jgi:hypothetical protein